MSGYEGDTTDFSQSPKSCSCPSITKEQSLHELYAVRGEHHHFERCRVFFSSHIGSYHRVIIVRLKEGVCLQDLRDILEPDGAITLSDENWINGIR